MKDTGRFVRPELVEGRMFMVRQAHHERNAHGFTPLDRWRHLTGFTLIEVMISMLIFATSMTAAFVFYTVIGRMDDSTRNLTQAVNDGRVVMEAIRNRAQSNGLGAPGGVTVFYPAGVDLIAPGRPFAELGPPRVEALENETITVAYGGGGDPLPVTVRVTWTEQRRIPARFIELETMMTTR